MNWKSIIPWDWFKHEDVQHTEHNNMVGLRKNNLSQTTVHHPIHQIHDEIDRLFNDTFQNFGLSSLGSELLEPNNFLNNRFFKPNTNISTKDNHYFISVEAPGLNDDDLEIELKDNILTLSYPHEIIREKKIDLHDEI